MLRSNPEVARSGLEPNYNIQGQANSGAQNTSVRKIVPKTVAGVLVPEDSEVTAEEVRTTLSRSAGDDGAMVTLGSK